MAENKKNTAKPTNKSDKLIANEMSADNDSKIWKDPRFSHLVNDPRFKQLPQSQRKVKIDKRFESMFNDNKFKVKYSLDKYGRKTDKTTTEDLKDYYELNSEDEESDAEKEEAKKIKDDFGNDVLDTDEELDDNTKKKLRNDEIDYARGYGVDLTDSSDGEESTDEEEEETFFDHVWGELDHDAPTTDDSTRRLAACNMDWDRMRATDIMVLCNSFLPPNGSILSVKIYPSEFGKERLAEEEVKGPQELREFARPAVDSSDEDDDTIHKEEDAEASEFHMEKLRQYQLNRLKYYYAVIECDSVETADKLYKECDGMEYESTATKLDLRFIPDEEEFNDDEVHDECKELPDLSKYQPRVFTTTALQQAKVELTWDETAVDRRELNDKLASGKMNEVSDMDLRKYIAYSSEDDEEEEKPRQDAVGEKSDSEEELDGGGDSNNISKYKQLLMDINGKEEDKKKSQIEREYTWGIGTESMKPSKSRNVRTVELTPFEKIIEKKKAKQKSRKAERKKHLGLVKSNSDEDEGGDESEDNLPDGIDMNDPYFAEEFRNGEFEEPKKLSSKSLKLKKNKKLNEIDPEEERRNAELALLIDDGDDDHKSHFSLKKILDSENEIKSKRKRKKLLKKSKTEIAQQKEANDDFQVNLVDNRFSAVYTSHEFNIDPTDSHFKRTKGMEKIIEEKLKRRRHECPEENNGGSTFSITQESPKKKKKDVAVSMLVKSIKRKVGTQ